MKYLDWHWDRLASPEVWLELEHGAWNHLFWLVENENQATMKWDGGRWIPRHCTKSLDDLDLTSVTIRDVSMGSEYSRAGGRKMDTKTFDWVCGQLTTLGYIVLRDELISRWKAHPEVQQDEAAEQEEWDRLAVACTKCGTPVKSVQDINGDNMNVLACECYEP